MARLDFGFGSQRSRLIAGSQTMMARLAPSEAWNGSEASGFAGSPPVDPVRLTAKPALRLITPPRQWFSDYQLVGVVAMANDGGTLIENLGLHKVIVHYEGATCDIMQPSFQTFPDANGNPVTYLGWWCRLEHDGRDGFGHVYFEAVPRDATMQHRVIGPYLFAPQPVQHLIELEVAATPAEITGQRYKTVGAALGWLRNQSPGSKNPRITITEAGKYAMNTESVGPAQTGMKGYVTIEVAEGIEASIGNTGYVDDSTIFLRNNSMPLHLKGGNLTLDLAYTVELDGGTGGYNDGMHWLDGCKLTSTHPDGRFELLRGGKIDWYGWRVDGFPWFTEVEISNIAGPASSCSLVRGCTITATTYDVMATTRCAIDNVMTDHNGDFWYTDWHLANVTYTGPEATATFRRTGGADGNDVVFHAEWGANAASFAVGQTYAHYLGTAGDGYDVEDLVNWLNTLPGWSATIEDAGKQDWRAGRLSRLGGASGPFPAQNVKDTVLPLHVGYNRHSDLFQGGGQTENVVIWGNRTFECNAVNMLIAHPNGSNGYARDLFFVNNVHHATTENSKGQWGKGGWTGSHLVVAHNSLVTQGLWLRSGTTNWNVDAYCLIANNAMTELRWIGPVDPDLTISDNHLPVGAEVPGGSTGTVIGGDETTLYSNAVTGDFASAGLLLGNRKAPIVRWDAVKAERGLLEPVGALAAQLI